MLQTDHVEIPIENEEGEQRQRLPSEGSVKKHFRDYCASTSIHGVKYLGEKGRPKMERIWWIFVFALSVVGSAYLIGKVWRKWHDSPVIVSFAETSTPVWQIPFPTVTICSETKARQRTFNFTNAIYSANLTEDEKKKRDDLSLICDRHLTTDGPRYTNESTINVIKEVAPQFDEMMWLCRWKMSIVNCSELFTPLLTEEGICFSFNLLHAADMYRDIVVQSKSEDDYMKMESVWSLEKGYDTSAPLETEPRRALGAGANAGISVVLRAYEYDLDYLCRGPVQGFKILLHNPAEIPRLSERYFRLPFNQELILSVKPNMMSTSEGLRSYRPSTRQCFFPSERHLTYFNVYTQRNCELECLANYTLKKCQCAAVFMPRLESMPLCGAGSKQCVNNASDDLSMEEIMLSMQKAQRLENTCDCLPACTSLQYDAETSQAYFNWIKLFGAYKENMSEFEGVQLSRVSIYFKDVQFITSRRSELYGVADFLANCGGLLGLFSGFSVLSLIEIVYYITLRLYTNVKNQKKRRESEEKSDDGAAVHLYNQDVFKVDPNEKNDIIE